MYVTCKKNFIKCLASDSPDGWGGIGFKREIQEGGGIYVSVTDSCGCMVETNTIL